MSKLCVLFPGIGYHCDKPLLYYSAKLARSRGYKVIALKFTDFPKGAKGNDEKMSEAAEHAFIQSEQQLKNIIFSDFRQIVFIGKSIGTAACLKYRQEYGVNARCVLLTPLEQTFEYSSDRCTAFHGTSDQWADTEKITLLCDRFHVKLHKYVGANHSLETGNVYADIAFMSDMVSIVDMEVISQE